MRTTILAMASLGCISFASLAKSSSLEQSQKRVKDHLLVKDHGSALSELKVYLAQFPQSKELQALRIRALSEAGFGLEAFKHWTYITQIHEELKQDESLIEAIAWSVLNQAENSSQYVVNISSMIGASLTKDAKAVQILLHYLRSTNSYIRMIAVQLSSQYGDKQLIEELKRMLSQEGVWYVKLEIIRALGRFQCEEVASVLQEMIASKRCSLEERAVAAEALVTWYHHLQEQELLQLLHSKRAGLRYLACEIIGYVNSKKYTSELIRLMKDTSAEVKMGAINALYVVGVEKSLLSQLTQQLEILTQDSHSGVAITACQLLMFYCPTFAKKEFAKWIKQESGENRRLAAAAIARSGPEGRKAALEWLADITDPFVKVNIAYGLLGHEEYKKLSSSIIEQFLQSVSENIMIDTRSNPMLRVLAPSYVRHTPEVSQYPEVIDQHVRLHLLNILAMMRYPGVEESIKKYLKNQHFGMTYAASAALITEGAENSLDIISSLLEDKDDMIRVQAALVLASMGGDKRAVSVLEEAYPKVTREVKMHILEALGHIGCKSSIPFLLRVFEDPFNVMRIIAASSIIQCIYH